MTMKTVTRTTIELMQQAQYIGDHPHIKDCTGVIYFDKEQQVFLFRPDTTEDGTNGEWYRVRYENLTIL